MHDSLRHFIPLALCLSSLALPACGGDDGGGGGGDEVGDTGTGTTTDTGEGTESSSTGESGSDTGTEGTGSETGTDATDTGEGTTDTGEGTTDTGEGTTDTGEGTDTGTETVDPCQEFSSDVLPIPPDVMFLLDRSGSMMEVGFDLLDPNKTRWQALYEAVEGVLTGGNEAFIGFGAKTFSTKGEGACGVSDGPDVPILLNNADMILATIPGPLEEVTGGTPTNLALDKTMAYMQSYETDSDKIVIFITDGRIGCTEDDAMALADAVNTLEIGLMDHGITTYVVGIEPSFNLVVEQLNAMALAGGAPSGNPEQDFYLADDADMLAAALNQVVEDSYGKSCKLNLDDPPFFPEYTKVVIGGMAFELVDDCANQDGFVYTDDAMTQIELCGAGCEALGEFQEAEVQFFCNPG